MIRKDFSLHVYFNRHRLRILLKPFCFIVSSSNYYNKLELTDCIVINESKFFGEERDGEYMYYLYWQKLDNCEKKELLSNLSKQLLLSIQPIISQHEMYVQVGNFLNVVTTNILRIQKLREEFYVSDSMDFLEKELEQIIYEILLRGHFLDILGLNKDVIDKLKIFVSWLFSLEFSESMLLKLARNLDCLSGINLCTLLDLVYKSESTTTGLDSVFDKVFLKSPFCVGLREGKQEFISLLKKNIEEYPADTVNILNINCGYCWEMKDIICSDKKLVFWGVDEKDVIMSNSLKEYKSENIKFTSIEDRSILNYKFDIIYFRHGEYEDDRYLKEKLSLGAYILSKKGRILFSHINFEKDFAPLLPQWICLWEFPIRKPQDIKVIIKESNYFYKYFVENDIFGYNLYYNLYFE